MMIKFKLKDKFSFWKISEEMIMIEMDSDISKKYPNHRGRIWVGDKPPEMTVLDQEKTLDIYDRTSSINSVLVKVGDLNVNIEELTEHDLFLEIDSGTSK